MARNRVQFQKGLSEAAFDEAYGTEAQCHAALVAWHCAHPADAPLRSTRVGVPRSSATASSFSEATRSA